MNPEMTADPNGMGAAEATAEVSAHDPTAKLYDLLRKLEITKEEGEAVDLSGLIRTPAQETLWKVILRVCMQTSFSHTAFFTAMQVAWGCAKDVKFRPLDDNTFTTEFQCFGDWNTAMHGGLGC